MGSLRLGGNGDLVFLKIKGGKVWNDKAFLFEKSRPP